jgi:predicted NUDIX family phosphoesterase
MTQNRVDPHIQQQPLRDHHDESILVVKRSLFFEHEPAWSGLKKVDFDAYLELITKHQEFIARQVAEVDPTYKQIIPYLIFCHDKRYFLMQRQAHASESRLQSKFSLGIGGHIRQEDLNAHSLIEWSSREFQEEVSYDGSYDIKPLGIINDDSNPVGQVHVGFVFLLTGDSPNIMVKSELKSGQLFTLQECKHYFNRMESWSQIVFEALLEQQ